MSDSRMAPPNPSIAVLCRRRPMRGAPRGEGNPRTLAHPSLHFLRYGPYGRKIRPRVAWARNGTTGGTMGHKGCVDYTVHTFKEDNARFRVH